MRVAVVTETFLPKIDGITKVACLLLDHLTKRGIETIVVAPKMSDIQQYNQTPVISVRGVPMPRYTELRFGPPTPAMYRAIRDFQPDIIHTFHPVFLGIPSIFMARRLGIPILASFHLDLTRLVHHFRVGFLESMVDYLTRLVLRQVDHCLAPSKLIQADLIGLGLENVSLWGRGVDAERFHPKFYSPEMRHRLSDGHPEDPLLVYIGRISTEKRLHDLQAVMEALPQVRLAMVGDGPMRSSVEKALQGTKTVFTGYLHGEALSQAFASGDVFVFTSALETFGLVVLEAMASGLPVVASRAGGIPDVVQEGYTGYTFNSGDTDTLIQHVQTILNEPTRMKQMGQQARSFAESLSWDAMMDEVIDHYVRLIDNHPSKK